MFKIWLTEENFRLDLTLFNPNTSQDEIQSNFLLLTEVEQGLKDWFKNFSYQGQLYCTRAITNYKDTDYKIKNVFVYPYYVKSMKEIKENPQIENLNNAICPACGYVDYYCWENQCPDENYSCPRCKAKLLLEHRFEYDYDGYGLMYQRTTFKSLPRIQKLEVIKNEC